MTSSLYDVFADNPFVEVATHNTKLNQLDMEWRELEARLTTLKRWLGVDAYCQTAASRGGKNVDIEAHFGLELLVTMLGETAVNAAFSAEQFEVFAAEIQEPKSPYHVYAEQIDNLRELVNDSGKKSVKRYPLGYLTALLNVLSPTWESESSELEARLPVIGQELSKLGKSRELFYSNAGAYIIKVGLHSLTFGGAAFLGVRFRHLERELIAEPYLVIPNAGPGDVTEDFFNKIPSLYMGSEEQFDKLEKGANMVTFGLKGIVATIKFNEYSDCRYVTATEVVLPMDSPLAEILCDMVEGYCDSLPVVDEIIL
ncbi:MAG: hypothetical protein ABIG95_01075 [Candidatus Woesearchaeota archaeon]